jgi:CRISPR-associated protein Cas2
MAGLTTLLVAYDVADDSRRARVAAALSRVGLRFQYSLFMCQVEGSRTEEFMAKISALIDAEVDRLFMLPLCATCGESAVAIGSCTRELEDVMWVI